MRFGIVLLLRKNIRTLRHVSKSRTDGELGRAILHLGLVEQVFVGCGVSLRNIACISSRIEVKTNTFNISPTAACVACMI